MKKINCLLQFLNKKGALLFGVIIGLVLSVFPVLVHAEYFDSYTGNLIPVCSYVGSDGNNHTLYFDGLENSEIRVACYYFKNKNSLEFGSSVSGRWIETNVNGKSYFWDGNSVSSRSYLGYRESPPLLTVLMFSTAEELEAYLNGETDGSSALNFDEISELNRTFDYDGNYPYFDRASMIVNQNDSASYNASMSQTQQDRYYQLLAKVIDKDGNATDSKRVAYMEYYATAIYADSEKLGLFNDYVLRWGNKNMNFINTEQIPNANKTDEIIQFDSNGRLKVSGYYGLSGHQTTTNFSGGGGRYGTAPFSFAENAPLIAVELESATVKDRCSVSPSFQKLLQSNHTIQKDSGTLGSLLGGYTIGTQRYTLIGYACDIRIVVAEEGSTNYTYSKDTYTYTWLSSAMRDRYGSQSSTYDEEGNQSTDKFQFDNDGNEVSKDLLNGQDIDMNGINGFIRSGFRLLDNNGVLSLMAETFSFVPATVWSLVVFAISILICFMLAKLFVAIF